MISLRFGVLMLTNAFRTYFVHIIHTVYGGLGDCISVKKRETQLAIKQKCT